MEPATYYQQRIEQLEIGLQKLQHKNTLLGWSRLLSSVGIIPILYFLWPMGWLYVVLSAIVLLVIFTRLIIIDLNNKAVLKHTEHLIDLNENEVKALNGEYFDFEDGASYVSNDHLYSNDLDIFGKASLYQYINRTTSAMGGAALSSWLLNPATAATISERQTAVKELHNQTDWRQALQAFGKEKKIKQSTVQRLQDWIAEEDLFISSRSWRLLQFLIPAMMFAVIVLNLFGLLNDSTINSSLVISAIIALFISRKVVPLHYKVSKLTEELDVLSDSIQLIENQVFKSPLLIRLQSACKHQHATASEEMKKLKDIIQRMDWRLNPIVFVPLAILFQWDLQQVIALEKWKKRNRNSIMQWFEALGNFEAISSLANLHFNHPDWCFPELKNEHFFIEGTAIGHPMISKSKRVNNSIGIQKKGMIMLVTGSNMAGKSTYLRSIGINTVLTMAGAVVCASKFSLSPVQLITSLRIADNLKENTSTFHAELKKLKTVIEMVNKKEKVFVLLDEIFRGTNSLDRHTGAVALTKQLIRKQAVGIIATHDVELAKLEADYPENILNFHFDAQVSNEELYFDYRLKKGTCTSINASLLMKKIGIEV